MVVIAYKLRVLYHVLVGGGGKAPPCSLHTVLQAAAYRVNEYLEDFLKLRKYLILRL